MVYLSKYCPTVRSQIRRQDLKTRGEGRKGKEEKTAAKNSLKGRERKPRETWIVG